jgi:hypothetical protein
MVIKVGPDLEAALNEQARRLGFPAEAVALKALRDQFLAPASEVEPQDAWERRLRQIATDCGLSLSDEALSSEGLYE